MFGKLSFVPKILLCGDEAEFLAHVGNRPFKIVGHVKFFGEVDGKPLNFFQDGKVYLNGSLQHVNELLKSIVTGDADYLVFNDLDELETLRDYLHPHGLWLREFVTIELFNSLTRNFFYDSDAEFQLFAWLKSLSIKTLLDVDGYFSQGKIFIKLSEEATEIDCITDKPLLPIMENIYAHTYKNFEQVGFKRYDAALIVERPPMDFISAFAFLENFSDRVITFVRNGSELERYIVGNAKNFANVQGVRTINGLWLMLTRHKVPEDFCMYVVTHKPTPHEGKLPEGYKLIHAGRALNKDLGYLGDNTGDNISHLNLYINEITALYWFWKNTTHTVIGLCHYRRFFTTFGDTTFAYEKILTHEIALKLLERYDMIIRKIYLHECSQREAVIKTSGRNFTALAEGIIKKHLVQVQPDYLDAFDAMLNSNVLCQCNMFVTHRNVFDAYCTWLFSFLIDATQEILRTADFETSESGKRRVMGYFAERLLTVWLMKNRLRIKELNCMLINGL